MDTTPFTGAPPPSCHRRRANLASVDQSGPALTSERFWTESATCRTVGELAKEPPRSGVGGVPVLDGTDRSERHVSVRGLGLRRRCR